MTYIVPIICAAMALTACATIIPAAEAAVEGAIQGEVRYLEGPSAPPPPPTPAGANGPAESQHIQ